MSGYWLERNRTASAPVRRLFGRLLGRRRPATLSCMAVLRRLAGLSGVEHQAVLLDRLDRAIGRRDHIGPDRRGGAAAGGQRGQVFAHQVWLIERPVVPFQKTRTTTARPTSLCSGWYPQRARRCRDPDHAGYTVEQQELSGHRGRLSGVADCGARSGGVGSNRPETVSRRHLSWPGR
jgi:hypothetical protein